MARILVVGVARSGTTWVANLIAGTPGVHYVPEPDNEGFDPFAMVGARGLGYLPALRPGDEAPAYRLLWDMAFAGGWPAGRLAGLARLITATRNVPVLPRSATIVLHEAVARVARRRRPPGEHQLVKSVRAVLSVEWVATSYQPEVIVMWRHPFNVVASWLELSWNARYLGDLPVVRTRFEHTPVWPPPPATAPVASAAWAVCAETVLLLETAARHPEWTVVAHEELSSDPLAGYRRLLDAVGLRWDPAAEARIVAVNCCGTGFETTRIASEEPARWRSRLAPDQIEAVARVVDGFESVSAVAAAAWPGSPAMRGQAEPAPLRIAC